MELSKMNRLQLRSACRDAKVKGYSKMTKEQMSVALAKLTTPASPVVKRTTALARDERNGVRKPIKGVCADVWLALDELRASGEENLTTAIRAIGEQRGWNRNNVSIELSAFRRYHSIVRPKRIAQQT